MAGGGSKRSASSGVGASDSGGKRPKASSSQQQETQKALDANDDDEADDEVGEEEEGEEEEAEGDDEELELSLDENGRSLVQGVDSMNFQFRTFPSLLSGVDIETLRKEVEAAFTARATEGSEKYSAGETFWLPASGVTPCNVCEKLALAIFSLHTKGIEYDVARSGVEWWTLVMDAADEVGWHWDRDYGLEEDTDFKLHPHIATVTYLSDEGAPTTILEVVQCGNDQLPGSLPLEALHVSKPQVGKHISFDGRFLHAAPAEMADFMSPKPDGEKSSEAEAPAEAKAGAKRYTLLANVWLNHKPVQPSLFPHRQKRTASAKMHVPDIAASSESPPTKVALKEGDATAVRVSWKILSAAADEEEEEEEKDAGDGDGQPSGSRIELLLPQALKEAGKGASVSVSFPLGASTAHFSS
mmetsp:Transcript_16025/g.37794  ORF Transcript_16025/g.37794 Transcript_16025/m.37794 type:complete len:414 (-) Transcript_16025:75-1316(-)